MAEQQSRWGREGGALGGTMGKQKAQERGGRCSTMGNAGHKLTRGPQKMTHTTTTRPGETGLRQEPEIFTGRCVAQGWRCPSQDRSRRFQSDGLESREGAVCKRGRWMCGWQARAEDPPFTGEKKSPKSKNVKK